ncbi:EutN/CcmL family microcompartment protein [Planctomicrobium piriforme]|uniref:Ethanolamine utilization protein EutN n=1 Tax=Planctomicrobium piriforme TaxID=1576369 RepID=A0A1I3DGR6_9PLAN|nr:EutN/CcmL family microcompartment protein [Planctomicrobium piriforme]SFH85843.1 ethanolamine utilization protein EutN [Planctomicrobium piriforme]
MRIGEVIGRITLSRCHPSVQGAVWKLVVPLSRKGLNGGTEGRGEPIVVFDEMGSGPGSMIAISDGAEASAPFHPEVKPIDAYCAALLDEIRVNP